MLYRFLLPAALCLFISHCSHQEGGLKNEGGSSRPLTVIAIGDAGEAGSALRANATLLTSMYTGQHDGGQYDAMIFLGDNFYNTGLNVPADEVENYVKKILGPFKVPFEGLGRGNIHAIAGNHDYYAKNAIETSVLFGLINIAEGPIGLTDKGNKREAAISQWTYYYNLPGSTVYPLAAGSPDSVQFIFVDSALPLRTDTSAWVPALDSLRNLLAASGKRKGIIWRILALHHPLYSVGEHAGYTVWNDETNTVDHLTPCDKDSNAVGWIKNFLDPEDLCADKYRQFMAALKSVIESSGTRIQLSLAGHEHSMQLLYYPEADPGCDDCPKIHVISGAGSKPCKVKFPSPPTEFTSAQLVPSKQGESVPGFAQLTFERETLRVVFFNGNAIVPMDMGGGRKEFVITADGHLQDDAK
ncbi:MAG: metallophosphoesterase [Bacteroidota bacterium]